LNVELRVRHASPKFGREVSGERLGAGKSGPKPKEDRRIAKMNVVLIGNEQRRTRVGKTQMSVKTWSPISKTYDAEVQKKKRDELRNLC